MSISKEFSGIRLKRKRAWDQIKSLKVDFDAFFASKRDAYAPRVHFSGKTQILTIGVHIQRPPDPMWGVRIGEVVHNLRSALDHMTWELYCRQNRKLPPRGRKNQFPIFETKAGFDGRGTTEFLKGIGDRAIKLIRSEQPFPVAEGGRGEGAACPLWHLKELSDCDKHRTLHLTGTLIESFNFKFPRLKRAVVVDQHVRKEPGPIQQDTILAIARFRGVTDWPFEKLEMEGHLRVDIAFDEGTPAVGKWLVIGTLIDMANRTDHILNRIATEIFRIEL